MPNVIANLIKSSTTTEVTTMSNTTKQEAINLNNINKSALVSTMAAELFIQGLSERVSMITAVAFIGAIDYLDDYEDFSEAFIEGMEITSLEIVGLNEQPECDIDGELVESILQAAKYLDGESVGPRLYELCELRSEAYEPTTGEIVRRFGYSKVKHSELFIEAIHALEATEYTVDIDILSIALQVQGKLGKDNDEESYVISGCQNMNPELAYKSEFKGDRRGRMYQAACHGPNGQSSDRSRALMNLQGVPTDYDVVTVKKHILAEIEDMVASPKDSAKELRELGDVEFIIKHLDSDVVKKPWSFVKAAKIMRELQAGNKPYIGMAVGLDAKCSGPQLGALMVGDQQIAAACGFTMTELDDAYHLSLVELARAGFTNITRNGIKKAYMGVFYGQGWAAFTDLEEIGSELANSLYGEGMPANDDTAKMFHKALVASFGQKMIAVRNLFKSYAKTTKGRTLHSMPDGFEVAMNYKVKTNILGEIMEYDTEQYDVRLRNNAESYKFINFQLKTLDVHEGDFARNGFVNMIQATDALIARLIVVHLKRLGAKHIISVHDCFRVNVTEMHLLEEAIKLSYMDLFGSEYNNSTSDLPLGTDILGLYFKGANKQLIEGEEEVMVSQFFSSGKRRLRKINSVKVVDLISSLGDTYYFAK